MRRKKIRITLLRVIVILLIGIGLRMKFHVDTHYGKERFTDQKITHKR